MSLANLDRETGTCAIGGEKCQAHERHGPVFRAEIRKCYDCGRPVCRASTCSRMDWKHRMRNGTRGGACVCSICWPGRKR